MKRVLILTTFFIAAFGFDASAFDVETCSTENLCTQPISWNVIGLDSNKPLVDGPDTFMVGTRVCNKSASTTFTNVTSTFTWLSINTYLTLADNPTVVVSQLEPGECADVYYNGLITRDSAAFDTARSYQITTLADSDGTPSTTSVSTPLNRELIIKNLVSQNRNQVNSITGPTSVEVGGVYTFVIDWKTATGGYEQLEHFVVLTNLAFRLLNSHSTYTSPTGATNDSIYADACGWDDDTTSANYLSCVGPTNYTGGKAGGTIKSWFTVQILSPGPTTLFGLVYDFSGNSFHYNSDYGDDTLSYVANNATDLEVTISDSPDPVVAGGTITYSGTVANNGIGDLRYDAVDPALDDGGVLTIPIPADTTYVTGSLVEPAGWDCSTNVPPTVITCTPNATFTSGTTATWSFDVVADNDLQSGSLIPAIASVTSEISDPDPSNNTATTTTLVSAPGLSDLSAESTSDPVVVATDPLTFTHTITNNGPADEENVTAVFSFPAGTTYTGITAPAGWTCGSPTPSTIGPGTVTCTASTLTSTTNGGTAQVFGLATTVTGAVGDSLTSTAETYSNDLDPNTSNNTSSTTTNIVASGSADLQVEVTAAPTLVTQGESVLYTNVITNNGPEVASNPTFTVVMPTDTYFTYIDPPFGWTCTTPDPGANGTITCTSTTALAVGESVEIPVYLTIGTASPVTPTTGDVITYTATVSADETDSIPSNNTDSVPVTVADSTSADVEVSKVALNSPVPPNTPLTYSIEVTNNGPATATGVAIEDILPAGVNYSSYAITQGTCTTPTAGTNGTVSCTVGSLTVGASAVLTLVVVPTSTGTVNNTATITSTTAGGDPIAGNDSSASSVDVEAPTAAIVRDMRAIRVAGRSLLTWRTGFEVDNLGFNIYRDVAGRRELITSSIIVGSALTVGQNVPLSAGRTYRWSDYDAVPGTTYWIEEISLDGAVNWHGPILPHDRPAGLLNREEQLDWDQSPTFDALAADSRRQSVVTPRATALSGLTASSEAAPASPSQSALAATPAAKILTSGSGVYRVTRADLVAAGFDPGSDPDAIQVFLDAREIPVMVSDGGDRRFDDTDSIEFYAAPFDSVFSATRAYWLTVDRRGDRIRKSGFKNGSAQTASGFPHTIERRDQSFFLATLLGDGDQNNFFGAIVRPTPPLTPQTLDVSNLDRGGSARLEVALQGVTLGVRHEVLVTLNGSSLGTVTFTDRHAGQMSFTLSPDLLREGSNDITLTGLGGPFDISLVDYLRLTYSHTWVGDDDELFFPASRGTLTTLSGFTTSDVRVIDVTDPMLPEEVKATISTAAGAYSVSINPKDSGERSLYAWASHRVKRPDAIVANAPSSWATPDNGADFVILTHPSFRQKLAPLVAKRTAEGMTVELIDVDDIYDEFNYGSKSPHAIRAFLEHTQSAWALAPRWVMLVGDATFDPKNNLSFGERDLVPTWQVPTAFFMTASDDWFVDFDDDGVPNLAIGRLSVSTLDEAETVVRKIVNQQPAASLRALLVADRNDEYNFENTSTAIATLVPPFFSVTHLFIGSESNPRGAFTAAVNSQPHLVDYVGHASVETIGKSPFFQSAWAGQLTNEDDPALFILIDCLNGQFHDLYTFSLGEALLRAPNGGAVAVWGSSALTFPSGQGGMHQQFYRILSETPSITIGEAMAQAKAGTSDLDVRRSWNLLGDPTMTLRN